MATINKYTSYTVDPNILSTLNVDQAGDVVSAEVWNKLWDLVWNLLAKYDKHFIDVYRTLSELGEEVDTCVGRIEKLEELTERLDKTWERLQNTYEKIEGHYDDILDMYTALSKGLVHYGVDPPLTPDGKPNTAIKLWVKPTLFAPSLITSWGEGGALATHYNYASAKLIKDTLDDKFDKKAGGEFFDVVGYGKNLFDPNDPNIVKGKLFDADGNLSVTNVNFITSGYIEVQAGRYYYPSCDLVRDGVLTRRRFTRTHCFYDENKNVVLSNPSESTYIFVPNDLGIKYLRYSTYAESYGGSAWQLEPDEQTDYVPYSVQYGLKEDIKGTSDAVITSSTINLFNPNDVYVNKVITDAKPLELYTTTYYDTTRPIYIKGYDSVVCQYNRVNENAVLPRAVVFYDDKHNVVAHYYSTGGVYPAGLHPHRMTRYGTCTCIPIPEGSVYVSVSINKNDINTYMIYGVHGVNVRPNPIPYVPYSECNKLKPELVPVESYIKSYFNGKKVVAIGDSITQGYTLQNNEHKWLNQLASMFNMTLVNYGIGASEIAQYKTGDNTYNPMCIRYKDMDDDADLIIIAGGTNDWDHRHTALGTFGDTSINTFYGALDTLCKGLLNKYPGKNIMFMTPIKRFHGRTVGKEYYVPSSRGYILEDFANAIKKVCGFYGIPVLDMFNECSLNPIIPVIADAYMPDGSHPNYEGHKIMARQIAGFVSKLACSSPTSGVFSNPALENSLDVLYNLIGEES